MTFQYLDSYRAVKKAIKPKTKPMALQAAIGISRSSLKSP